MNQVHSHFVSVLWTIWLLGMVTIPFLVLEFLMLGLGRPQDTLSENVWRMERLIPGQDVTQWSAVHLLFMGLYTLIFGWLFLHFGWGMWR